MSALSTRLLGAPALLLWEGGRPCPAVVRRVGAPALLLWGGWAPLPYCCGDGGRPCSAVVRRVGASALLLWGGWVPLPCCCGEGGCPCSVVMGRVGAPWEHNGEASCSGLWEWWRSRAPLHAMRHPHQVHGAPLHAMRHPHQVHGAPHHAMRHPHQVHGVPHHAMRHPHQVHGAPLHAMRHPIKCMALLATCTGNHGSLMPGPHLTNSRVSSPLRLSIMINGHLSKQAILHFWKPNVCLSNQNVNNAVTATRRRQFKI